MNEATSLFGALSGDVSERLGDPITDKLTYSLVDQRPMPRFLAGSERATQTRERGLYHLLFYLRSGMGYKATDPRDYVYALLGLAEDREALGIIPDYTQPVEDVFTDVTRRLVANGYTDSLAFALSTKATTGLPSWVPDWRSMSHVFFCTFRTAQDQPSLETAHVTFDVADKFRLPIRAAHVGTITKLAPALPGGRDWATLMARGADPFTTTLLEWLSSVENELLLSPAEEQAQYLNNSDPVVVGMTRRAQDRARLARSLCAMRSPVSDTWRRDQPERYYHLLAAMFRDEAVYGSLEQDKMEKHKVQTYAASILWHAKNQCRAFRLSSGHLGLASPGCEVGDEIVYFPGGSFPFVVREGVDAERELVGIAFVDDFRFWLMKQEPARVIVLR
ncbi:hypothetical protein NEMBOFW57_009371 [Staphylotrichum longicolle]|uniref:Uncharacterized protein n=1 Tax=Staphylotrichum longicolle TaxID=669026 RepID=A0AAD4HVW9_9PEZI|nr:hypothetical protein NEMBOFW57_009371 [Staphylotrichum longicolle]